MVDWRDESERQNFVNREGAGGDSALDHLARCLSDGETQFQLGRMYFRDGSVKSDPGEAIKWLQRAASQGHPDAQLLLIEVQARTGNAEAQFQLGQLYFGDETVKPDPDEAMKWLRRAASQGHPDAQFQLGRMYFRDGVVNPDPGEAMKWLQRAASQGHARARDLFEKVLAERGDPEAQFQWGRKHLCGTVVAQDRVGACMWLCRAANQGHARARDLVEQVLGELDYSEAQRLLVGVRAILGDGEARRFLVWIRAKLGEGGVWGCLLVRLLAELGDSEAQYQLGRIYFHGEGVARNRVEAGRWFRRAAKQGHADAQSLASWCGK